MRKNGGNGKNLDLFILKSILNYSLYWILFSLNVFKQSFVSFLSYHFHSQSSVSISGVYALRLKNTCSLLVFCFIFCKVLFSFDIIHIPFSHQANG